MRRLWIFVYSLWTLTLPGLAQTPPDSVHPAEPPGQTLFVIPAGPVAGSFTPPARLSIIDTVAGWAHIQVEGWVPVSAVLDRLPAPAIAPPVDTGQHLKSAVSDPAQEAGGRCAAITKSGKRCKRNAAPGSAYCWQHQNQK
jgi:hypothetical protein